MIYLDFFERRRHHRAKGNIFWPSVETVSKIGQTGCHVVPKPSAKESYSYTHGMYQIADYLYFFIILDTTCLPAILRSLHFGMHMR